jgi:hypothetical protein
MPITVAHNPGEPVIMLTFTDEWTWLESLSAFKHAIVIANQGGRRLGFVFDLSRNSFMPPTGLIPTLQECAGLARSTPHIGACIIVFSKAQTQLKAMVKTALDRVGTDCEIVYVGSLTEALDAAARMAYG